MRDPSGVVDKAPVSAKGSAHVVRLSDLSFSMACGIFGSCGVVEGLGLEEIGYVEPKPGIPPDPQHLARLIAVMKQDRAQLLLVEDFYNKSVASLVAQKAGAKMLDLPTDVGATPQVKDWFTLVETVLKALSSSV